MQSNCSFPASHSYVAAELFLDDKMQHCIYKLFLQLKAIFLSLASILCSFLPQFASDIFHTFSLK